MTIRLDFYTSYIPNFQKIRQQYLNAGETYKIQEIEIDNRQYFLLFTIDPVKNIINYVIGGIGAILFFYK